MSATEWTFVPRFPVPLPAALLAVSVRPEPHELNRESYLAAQADRLTKMLEEEPDPQEAVHELAVRMEEAGMVGGYLGDMTPEEFSHSLANHPLVENALAPRLTVQWPLRVEKDDPRAAEVLRSTSLAEWAAALEEAATT